LDAVLLSNPVMAIFAGTHASLSAGGVIATRSSAPSGLDGSVDALRGHRVGWPSGDSAAPADPAPEPEIATTHPPGGRRGPQGGGASSSGGGGAPPSLIVTTAFALVTASCCWFIAGTSPRVRCPDARCLERPG
jgi:hypothetical protein